MPRCSATGCRNMGSHTFPKDPVLRKVWEKATKKENFKASKHSRLCSGHFKPSDYIDVCVSTGVAPYHKYLKKTAVPSIFPCKNETSNASDGGGEIEINTSTPTPKENDVKESDVKDIDVKENVGPPQEQKEPENNSADENKPRDRSVRLRNRKAYLANRKCSVPHCNTRPSNEVSLHPCPNNAAVRNEWAEALKVSYQYVKNMVACSLHFTKIDFIQSKNSGRVLKHNAVPSRNLPFRKKLVVQVKNKPLKKVGPSKTFQRQKTMIDTVQESKEQTIRECRACLIKLDDKRSCCDVFQAWAPPWNGMEATIAEDLAKLANIEISISDRHSKILCAPCYQKLLDAATFAAEVRRCDLLLRMRFTDEIDMEKVWPKPIQVDKNINDSVYNSTIDVKIKEEVLSDDEYPVHGPDNIYVDTQLANLDIKIEPEELVEPPPLNIVINGTISLDPLNSENKDIMKNNSLMNGTELHQETQYLEMEVKQEPPEPMSEGEQDSEQILDLPLECLLCTKSFNSVTGLKAHVIAQHSYKTVKRKSDGSVTPEKKRSTKYQCAICRRNFETSTDLMVHETIHNKHACYGCSEKFDTFLQLSRHRKRCKASIAKSVTTLKTLDDVKRLLPEAKVENLDEVQGQDDSENILREEDNQIEETNCDLKEKLSEDIHTKSITEVENDDLSKDGENSVNKEDGEIKEDSDSSMKLHLEIHSSKTETEATLSDSDMQVETLKSDDT